MPNFIFDAVALPTSKTDYIPASQGNVPTTQVCQASDWNTVFTALSDIRSDLKFWQGTTTAISYAALTTDYAVYCNATGITITLPAGAVGLTYLIKDITGNASPNITIATTSSQNIDASTTATISSAYGWVAVVWDVTNTRWRVISQSSGGGGSTGNYTFSANNVTLTGAATATMFTSTATGLTIGGTNLTSGYTITAGGASTVTTTSGGLTLTAAGTVNVQNSSGAVVLGNTSGITTLRGGSTSSVDFSAGNGVFKTTTGAHTFGSASWAVPANTVITGASSATNTTGLSAVTTVADGASSIAFDYNNAATFSTAGWKMARWRNNGTEFASLTGSTFAGGGLRFAADGSAFLDMSLNGATNIGYGSNYIGIGSGSCIFNGQGPRSDGSTTLGASGSLWPATWTKRLIPGTQNIAFSATPAFDPTAGNTIHFGPVTGNITGPTMVSGSPGERCTIVMVKDGTAGAYTVTASWGSNVRTTSSTFTTGAGSLIVLNFVWDDRLSTPAWVQMSGLGFN